MGEKMKKTKCVHEQCAPKNLWYGRKAEHFENATEPTAMNTNNNNNNKKLELPEKN